MGKGGEHGRGVGLTAQLSCKLSAATARPQAPAGLPVAQQSIPPNLLRQLLRGCLPGLLKADLRVERGADDLLQLPHQPDQLRPACRVVL